MSDGKKTLVQLILAGLLSGGVLSAVLTIVLIEQTTKIEQKVKTHFQSAFEVFRSKRE